MEKEEKEAESALEAPDFALGLGHWLSVRLALLSCLLGWLLGCSPDAGAESVTDADAVRRCVRVCSAFSIIRARDRYELGIYPAVHADEDGGEEGAGRVRSVGED